MAFSKGKHHYVFLNYVPVFLNKALCNTLGGSHFHMNGFAHRLVIKIHVKGSLVPKRLLGSFPTYPMEI